MEHGILSGTVIEQAVKSGDIVIDPYNPAQLNPASYDVTLGHEVCCYTDQVQFDAEYQQYNGTELHIRELGWLARLSVRALDARAPNHTKTVKMSAKGFLLKPGIGYLLHTAERVRTDKYVPIVDGKSSIGRLFITVHVTAGYGDPGFDGQYTLETVVTHPVIVYPGMRIAQMRFHTMVGEPKLYEGNYRGDASKGPIASKSYKQFTR